jgi:hypothetical protein
MAEFVAALGDIIYTPISFNDRKVMAAYRIRATENGFRCTMTPRVANFWPMIKFVMPLPRHALCDAFAARRPVVIRG